MRTSENIHELAAALAKAQGQFTNPVKDVDNPFFKSKYADLAAIMDVIRKPLSDAGISFVQPASVVDGSVVITTRIMHGNQWIEEDLAIKPAKLDAQGVAGCATYGKRIALQAMLGVAAEDDDDGTEASGHHEAPPPKRVERPTPAAKPAEQQKPAAHPAPSADAIEKRVVELVRDILGCRTVDALAALQAQVAKASTVCNPEQMARIHAAVAAANGVLATAPKPADVDSVAVAYEAASTDAELDAADKAAAKIRMSLTAEHEERLAEKRKQAVANVEAVKM